MEFPAGEFNNKLVFEFSSFWGSSPAIFCIWKGSEVTKPKPQTSFKLPSDSSPNFRHSNVY